MPANLEPWLASLRSQLEISPSAIELLPPDIDGWQRALQTNIRTLLGTWDALEHRLPGRAEAFDALVASHIDWWERFFRDPRDHAFVSHRLAFGTTHADCGVALPQLLATQSCLASELTTHITQTTSASTQAQLQAIASFGRLVTFDAVLLSQSYELQRARGSEVQRREQSNIPILRIQGALVAAIHNEIASQEFPLFRRELLQRIRTERVQHVLLDVSGIPYIDSIELKELRGLIDLIWLLGAKACLVGLQPHVASALWALDANLQLPWAAGDIDTAFIHIEIERQSYQQGKQP